MLSGVRNLELADALSHADHFDRIGHKFLTPEPKFLAANTNLGLKTLIDVLQALMFIFLSLNCLVSFSISSLYFCSDIV